MNNKYKPSTHLINNNNGANFMLSHLQHRINNEANMNENLCCRHGIATQRTQVTSFQPLGAARTMELMTTRQHDQLGSGFENLKANSAYRPIPSVPLIGLGVQRLDRRLGCRHGAKLSCATRLLLQGKHQISKTLVKHQDSILHPSRRPI